MAYWSSSIGIDASSDGFVHVHWSKFCAASSAAVARSHTHSPRLPSQRHGPVPTDQPMTQSNNAYTILPSNDGDNGLAVNKAGYTHYPETSWFKIGLKVMKSGRGTYSFTFQSSHQRFLDCMTCFRPSHLKY